MDEAEQLSELLAHNPPHPNRPIQLEEFVVGEESSFETFSVDGKPYWHSLSHYYPSPLTVMTNPWIMWRMVLPREIDEASYDDVREVGYQALQALGMTTGVTHMEWFRREDGRIAVGEIAARPPGEQIVMMINRAHDVSFYAMWAQLMVQDTFEVPRTRRYAVGTLFLRGIGGGRVKAVHGLQEVQALYGEMVTDVQIPQPGQPAGVSYEGEGYLILRHSQTEKVKEALDFIASRVRVEMVQ